MIKNDLTRDLYTIYLIKRNQFFYHSIDYEDGCLMHITAYLYLVDLLRYYNIYVNETSIRAVMFVTV